MKISVIVPWHRAERWWAACEASLARSLACAETSHEWEMVVVRDEEGKGVAWARNEGLRRAAGDWIAWVDADDEVTEAWAPGIARAVTEHPAADVIVFDFVNDGVPVCWGRAPGDVPIKCFCRDLMGDGRLKSYLWNKIFRRDFLADRHFVEKAGFEDYDFWTRQVADVRAVAYVPFIGYRHIGRTDGLIARSGASPMWVRCAWERFRHGPCRYAVCGGLLRAIYHYIRVRMQGGRGQ